MFLTRESLCGIDPMSVKLSVLHVLQPTQAGVWRYACEMTDWQAENGWDVHIACPTDPRGVGTWHPWPAVRSPVRAVRREAERIRTIVEEVNPQVIVAHSSKAGLVTRLALRGSIPTVFIPHAWSFQALKPPFSVAALAWERVATRWTNAVVAVGAGEAHTGVAKRIRAPIFLVANPVPRRWSAGVRRERAALGLPNGPLVVCVGRLARQKGVDILLKAWSEVRARIPSATLVIVGDGPDRSDLESAAGPGVLFVGEQCDPWSYVDAGTIAVVPSRWEGLSLSMLEAMWSGKSMVVTRVDGSEVVERARCGAVVDLEDWQALGGEMRKRLEQPALAVREGERAARYARTNHEFDVAASRLCAVTMRAYAFGAPSGRSVLRDQDHT